MSLYDRDFNILTEDEKVILESYQKLQPNIKEIDLDLLTKNNGEITRLLIENKFLSNHLHLFPNNFFPNYGYTTQENKDKLKDFISLIDTPDVAERDVLNFIRDRKAFFIVASLLDRTHFGHHSRALFREFGLGSEYKADFLLIGKNSFGYHFIFIELESVVGQITIEDGSYGTILRKGVNQVEDWRSFLERDYLTLKSVFNKHKGQYDDLPKEFYEYNSVKMNFIVIAGRRKNFKDKTRKLAEIDKRQKGIELIHYDRLIEYSKALVESGRIS